MRHDVMTPGAEISYVAGPATLRLTAAHGWYWFTVTTSTGPVADLCGMFPDEETARAVARGYAVLFRREAVAA